LADIKNAIIQGEYQSSINLLNQSSDDPMCKIKVQEVLNSLNREINEKTKVLSFLFHFAHSDSLPIPLMTLLNSSLSSFQLAEIINAYMEFLGEEGDEPEGRVNYVFMNQFLDWVNTEIRREYAKEKDASRLPYFFNNNVGTFDSLWKLVDENLIDHESLKFRLNIEKPNQLYHLIAMSNKVTPTLTFYKLLKNPTIFEVNIFLKCCLQSRRGDVGVSVMNLLLTNQFDKIKALEIDHLDEVETTTTTSATSESGTYKRGIFSSLRDAKKGTHSISNVDLVKITKEEYESFDFLHRPEERKRHLRFPTRPDINTFITTLRMFLKLGWGDQYLEMFSIMRDVVSLPPNPHICRNGILRFAGRGNMYIAGKIYLWVLEEPHLDPKAVIYLFSDIVTSCKRNKNPNLLWRNLYDTKDWIENVCTHPSVTPEMKENGLSAIPPRLLSSSFVLFVNNKKFGIASRLYKELKDMNMDFLENDMYGRAAIGMLIQYEENQDRVGDSFGIEDDDHLDGNDSKENSSFFRSHKYSDQGGIQSSRGWTKRKEEWVDDICSRWEKVVTKNGFDVTENIVREPKDIFGIWPKEDCDKVSIITKEICVLLSSTKNVESNHEAQKVFLELRRRMGSIPLGNCWNSYLSCIMGAVR